LRVFGNGGGTVPSDVKKFTVDRLAADRCVVNLKWKKSPDDVGFNIRYGTERNKLYHNYQVLDSDSVTIRSLNSESKYYFMIDAFNENGIREGSKLREVE
jgi:xylan 1,4-beta-xylosidase